MQEKFRKFANKVSVATGKPTAFFLALAVVIVWLLSGPFFNFSDTWQLIINTGTTIVTFLMVFLIQNTQNRDGKAMQLKLDELIRAQKGARTSFIELEDLKDEELETLLNEFKAIHEKHSAKLIKTLQEKIEQERERRRKTKSGILHSMGSAMSKSKKSPLAIGNKKQD